MLINILLQRFDALFSDISNLLIPSLCHIFCYTNCLLGDLSCYFFNFLVRLLSHVFSSFTCLLQLVFCITPSIVYFICQVFLELFIGDGFNTFFNIGFSRICDSWKCVSEITNGKVVLICLWLLLSIGKAYRLIRFAFDWVSIWN